MRKKFFLSEDFDSLDSVISDIRRAVVGGIRKSASNIIDSEIQKNAIETNETLQSMQNTNTQQVIPAEKNVDVSVNTGIDQSGMMPNQMIYQQPIQQPMQQMTVSGDQASSSMYGTQVPDPSMMLNQQQIGTFANQPISTGVNDSNVNVQGNVDSNPGMLIQTGSANPADIGANMTVPGAAMNNMASYQNLSPIGSDLASAEPSLEPIPTDPSADLSAIGMVNETDLSRIFKLKQLYIKLIVLKDILKHLRNPKYEEIRNSVLECLDHFKLIINNFELFRDRLPDLIELFERFVITVYKEVEKQN